MIGAGAAGILAALHAAELGARVLILEKTPRLGTKITISGGGKCNITHDGPLEDVLRAFRPNEARFIRPACYRFPPPRIVEMLTRKGLEVYTRPDGRIFPVDGTAKDVVRILTDYLHEAGVRVRLEAPVGELLGSSEGMNGVRLKSGEEIHCERVVLAVGGSSYPNSGTTGDGWPWVRKLGHTIVPIRAALAPMHVALPWEPPKGVALRGCILKARRSGKEVARWRGDLLFTHQGVSGPCALGISREVERADTLEVDHLPDQSFEQVTASLVSFAQSGPRRLIAGFLEDFMPASIAALVMADSGLDPRLIGSGLDKKGRARLVERIKMWPLGAVTHVPLEKGEVVAGGVSLDEVDPQSMRSRRVPGLYLCGEVLDVAGPVGGYNLQAAWATGWVAGESAARDAGF